MSNGASTSRQGTLILGVGNPLMGDDALGILAVEQLRERSDLPQNIDIVDGGTDGLGLIPLIEAYHRVIIIDAVPMKLPPGTIRRFTWQEVCAIEHAGALSLHHTDLTDTLRLAEVLDSLPEELVIYGVQPKTLDWDQSLSSPVQEALPKLINALIAEVGRKN